MAKYKSKYPSLGFVFNGELKRFYNGEYTTTDVEEIDTLERVSDAIKQDEAPAKAQPKQTEAKPATKSPARKSSAK